MRLRDPRLTGSALKIHGKIRIVSQYAPKNAPSQIGEIFRGGWSRVAPKGHPVASGVGAASGTIATVRF